MDSFMNSCAQDKGVTDCSIDCRTLTDVEIKFPKQPISIVEYRVLYPKQFNSEINN